MRFFIISNMPYQKEDAVKLAEYLRQQRAAGYSIPTLRDFLIKHSYDPKLVDAAIDYMYKSKKLARSIPSAEKKFIAIVLIIIAIIGLGFAFLRITGLGEDSIDKPELVKPTRIEKEIYKEPTKDIDNDKNFPKSELEEEDRQIKKDSRDETPYPTPKQGIKEVRERGGPTITEIETKVAKMSEIEADKFCSSFSNKKKDNCYSKLAFAHNKSIYCKNIDSSRTRDNCYVNFAFAGDYELCDKIENQYQKLSCRSLGQARRYQEKELFLEVGSEETLQEAETSNETNSEEEIYYRWE